jgi:hypothetical protein
VSPLTTAAFQRQQYDAMRTGLAAGTTPVEGLVATGTPLALLDIPGVGLHQEVVVEGSGPAQTATAVGHRRDTVLPGRVGTAVLDGRSVTGGAPFAGLASLRLGDEVDVTDGLGSFRFRVDGLRRAGDPIPATAPGRAHLQLVTSTGATWQRGFVPTGLLYADATLVGDPAAAAPAAVTVPLSDGEQAWGTEQEAWVPVAFWLQLTLVALVGVVWLWFRVGHWHAWVVGVPVLLAVLWGLARAAHLLLPNVV